MSAAFHVAIYVAVSALITIGAVGAYPETRHQDPADDPALDRTSGQEPVTPVRVDR